jgi:hypothetical protein
LLPHFEIWEQLAIFGGSDAESVEHAWQASSLTLKIIDHEKSFIWNHPSYCVV